MLSRAEIVARGAALVALLLCARMALAESAPPPRPPLDAAPIEQTIDRLVTESDRQAMETKRVRQFKRTNAPPQAREPRDDNAALLAFLRWLADSARVLVWIAGIALALVAAWLLPRWWRLRGDPAAARLASLPTHVMALDIRPDSLPDDIGAAAAALWRRGEQRAALSLLYRGALSRLVHVHQVPIRAASTEGECLALARPRLDGASADYLARLVAMWQRAVYAGVPPVGAELQALCDGFAAGLPSAPLAAEAPR